jgi:Ca2+-binding EF-hand superfamily protein
MSHDHDGSGTVDTAELGDILNGMGVDLSPDVLASILKDIDKDRTGTIIAVCAHATYSE